MHEAIDFPNLLNGISRQPANLRLASQGERQVNGVSDIVKGLRKRPGTEFLTALTGLTGDNVFHVINRDVNRRFLVAMNSTQIKAWNLSTLAPVPVTNSAALAYLNGTGAPRDYLKMMSVADYTFILNKTKSPAMNAVTTGHGNYKALITLNGIRNGVWFEVTLNGRLSRTATNGSGDTSELQGPLVTNIINSIPLAQRANWTVESIGSNCIYIENLTGADFTLKINDGGSTSKVIKERIQSFEYLPATGKDGFKVNIQGTNSTKFDDYWVSFSNNGGKESGVWNETNGFDVQYQLNNANLPHALVVNAAGTGLTFQRLTWGDRLVGDAESAPTPSFVGRTISDIFYFRNRLGFLSDENVLLSEAGEYFNFFPTTVTDVLDSDPIDIGTSHTQVAILKYALPVADRLVIFSDHAQFMDHISNNDILTPKTAAFAVVSEYEADTTAQPIVTKQSTFFPQKNGLYTRLFEMFPDAEPSNSAADLTVDVTEHVPDFLPPNIRRMQFHQGTNTLFILSDNEPNRIYVYKYLWKDKKRVQASWAYWDFSTDQQLAIADFFVVDNLMYLIRKGNSLTDYRLSQINLELQPDEPDVSPYNLLLDNKVLLTGVYDAVNNWTTWTLPLTSPVTVPYSVIKGSGFGSGVGLVVPNITRPTPSTVRATGDYSAAACVVGSTYTFIYEFSRFYKRDQDGQAIEDGRTQCKSLTLYCEDTGYLKAQVIRKTDTRTYEITGLKLRDKPTISNPLIASGSYRIPLHSRNENIRVVLSSDSALPVQISKARVIVDYNNVDRGP